MSPSSEIERPTPLCASTPLAPKCLANGYSTVDGPVDKHVDKSVDNCDTVNGNVNVNIVSASTNNMDVLSGGESDAGDTLSRRNNNSISSVLASTSEVTKRRGDVTYFVAKELLMTERTYKRDLELVTVRWSKRVGRLGRRGSSGAEACALARSCLALEPLALPSGALLAKLDRMLAAASPASPASPHHNDNEEPEYKKIAELLYDYLSSTIEALEAYAESVGALVGLVESARRRGGGAAGEARAFDAAAPLPLACLLLRPLHRHLHYRRLALELCEASNGGGAREAAERARALAERAAEVAGRALAHAEHHAALCQMQRDLAGYDKLLVAEREFIRLGCVYKHSSKGLQQRMLFLFSDMLVVTSRCSSGQFRAHVVLPLHTLHLEPANLNNSFTLTDEVNNVSLTLSASNEAEYMGWYDALADAVAAAADCPTLVDTDLTPCDIDDIETEGSSGGLGGAGGAGGAGGGGGLPYVCWHRATSLARDHLHLAMRTQLSGYLLRKFKNSHGWQKLWVVFAAFTLFFYKGWQDEQPLASLPLLGYSVCAPSPSDGIEKDFVFKLQYKNHVYFFRADSHFTYSRWVEVLQTPMVHARRSSQYT